MTVYYPVYYPIGWRYDANNPNPKPLKVTRLMTTLSLTDLLKEVSELNTKQGWNADRDQSDECRLGMVALVHSEISEALEDVRNGNIKLKLLYSIGDAGGNTHEDTMEMARINIRKGTPRKPCGLPSELADIVIRCLDFCSWFNIPVLELTRPQVFSPNGTVRPRWAAARLGKMHQVCSDEDMNEVIRMAYDLAGQYGVALDDVLAFKHAYNKTRPTKHGGKTL